MPPFVPPHLRGKSSLNLKPERRFKAIIIVKQGPKYIVVEDATTKNLTFPGGGCHSTNSKRTENKIRFNIRR